MSSQKLENFCSLPVLEHEREVLRRRGRLLFYPNVSNNNVLSAKGATACMVNQFPPTIASYAVKVIHTM